MCEHRTVQGEIENDKKKPLSLADKAVDKIKLELCRLPQRLPYICLARASVAEYSQLERNIVIV